MNNLKEYLIGKTIVDIEFISDYYTYFKFSDGTKLEIAPDEDYTLFDNHKELIFGCFSGDLIK